MGEGTWLAVTCCKRNPEGGSFEERADELIGKMDAALRCMDCYFPCELDVSSLEWYHYAGGENANSAMCTFMVQIGKLVEEENEEEEEEEEACFFSSGKHFSM